MASQPSDNAGVTHPYLSCVFTNDLNDSWAVCLYWFKNEIQKKNEREKSILEIDGICNDILLIRSRHMGLGMKYVLIKFFGCLFALCNSSATF